MLSQKAEETLTEFAAVKKADIQLQIQLGNRKGQIAANVIGAFAESQNSAFGWQVRAFGAENDTKGANAGVFFRRLDGESLYGINSFVDYEKGDYGEFLRYGIGGELQNRYASFAMNYYLPITDDKHNGSTVAFSQKGYDANLRINIPRLDFLKVRADYYHFDGKYGGENDNGFRYGLEVQPIANLRIGAFYDDGGEKFGGDIAYVYNIAPPQKRELTEFAPDLFSPILREYSQRIITATTGPQIEVLPIADCRLDNYGNAYGSDSTATAFAVKLVWLVCVMSFPLVLCQWLLPPTKAIIHKKTRMSSFFVKKFVILAQAGINSPQGGEC